MWVGGVYTEVYPSVEYETVIGAGVYVEVYGGGVYALGHPDGV